MKKARWALGLAGLGLDSRSIHSVWIQIDSPQKILDQLNAALDRYPVFPDPNFRFPMTQETHDSLTTKIWITFGLLAFLWLFQATAYLQMARRRRWAETYVLTVASGYLLFSLLDFDPLGIIFGVLAWLVLKFEKKLAGLPFFGVNPSGTDGKRDTEQNNAE